MLGDSADESMFGAFQHEHDDGFGDVGEMSKMMTIALPDGT